MRTLTDDERAILSEIAWDCWELPDVDDCPTCGGTGWISDGDDELPCEHCQPDPSNDDDIPFPVLHVGHQPVTSYHDDDPGDVPF